MKIGLDYHGVIDSNFKMFSELSKLFKSNGHEVHIITGNPLDDDFLKILKDNEVEYTHLFSLLDYHKSKNTHIEYRDNKFFIDPVLWDQTKSEYCKKHQIDLHIDDSDEYGKYFTTPFLRFYSKNCTKL